MLQLNKKTEYALIAMVYMAEKVTDIPHAVISAREVAQAYRLPYQLLAKVMQQISGRGLIKSVQGMKGGYILARRPNTISVADVVETFDGPVAVADCFREEKITCPQWDGCQIRDPFQELNHKIRQLLAETTVADLIPKNSTTNQVSLSTSTSGLLSLPVLPNLPTLSHVKGAL